MLCAAFYVQPEAEAIVRLITGKDSVPSSVRKVLSKTAKQNGGIISVGMQ
jgi:hypothetical protein